ncbi:MAG: response regulator [Deltaproteobacteria bacterium]|nr:response regulator [Deltaproteobacteria bacterium]
MDNTILVVDDEKDICEVMDISLSDLGYDVHTAESAEEALEIFRKIKPPIVLTDIRMPGMDGIELLRRIKKEKPDTEVIMITGHGDMDLAIKSLKLEATDFITKPINDDVLEIALNRARERISMRRRLREYTENLEKLVKEKSEKLVEAERLLAVGQVLELLPSATRHIVEDLEGGIRYFNEMPCMVAIHNRDLKVVTANQIYLQRFGDRKGEDSWGIYSGGSGTRTGCPVYKTFATGKGQRSKETIKDSTGREFPVIVHTAPIRSKEQEAELVMEMSVDIMEITRLQEELRATQERYQQLFDEVPCYISVQDRDFRITAMNRKFKEDFGGRIGNHCYEVYKHRSEICPDCPALKTFGEETSQQYETVVTSRKGDQYNVLIWTAPLRNTFGEVTHVLEISTNITQIRKLQDRLTSLGLLLGSISHSVKGLLTGLDGGLYWIDSGIETGDRERLTKGLDTIKLIVGRIKNLVLNLLYYAKERSLNLEYLDVKTFAEDVARAFEPTLEGHDIQLKTDFAGATGYFHADRGVLTSALLNILENARDACFEDTSDKGHEILFRVAGDGDHLAIAIQDNGIGMDRETRENIFTLFFSSKGGRGTGLGLFVSHEIIQKHGGTINVESAPGQGTLFLIRIPRTQPESSQNSSTQVFLSNTEA